MEGDGIVGGEGESKMSVHLILRKRDAYGEHEGWRNNHQFNNGGHKHFARRVLVDLPKEEVRDREDGLDFDWLARPADFAAWRNAISADPELEGTNLLTLVDLLEAHPDYWLYVSQ